MQSVANIVKDCGLRYRSSFMTEKMFRYQNQIKEFYDTKPYKVKLSSDKEKHEWKINFIDNHDIVIQIWNVL